jgi:hypothetical protein
MIGIRALQGTLHPIANVYIDCPFESDIDWNRLLNAVAKMNFKHSLLEIGTIHHGWTCTICHGTDHLFGLYLLPSVPGWIKATLITPIVKHRNWFNWQPLSLEVCKSYGEGSHLGQSNTACGQGSSSHSHGN